MEEPEGRLRFLDYAEEASLLKVAPLIVQDVIVIGTNCGIRIASEALTLTWNNVDFLRNQLTVSAAFAKAGETRSVPLNSRARAVLVRLKAQSRGRYVFASPTDSPIGRWTNCSPAPARTRASPEQVSHCTRSGITSPAAW